MARITREALRRSCDPKGGHPCSTTSSVVPASATASGSIFLASSSQTTSLTSLGAGMPRTSSRNMLDPSRILRLLARVGASGPRGDHPGHYPLVPPRSSTRACRPGPCRPRSGMSCVALNHGWQLPGGPTKPARPAAPPSPVDAVLDRYRNHLRDICGLTEATCSYRLQHAREFLGGKFGEAPRSTGLPCVPRTRSPSSKENAARCRPGTAQVVASSLASFLRLLQLHGHCAPAPLAAVLVSPAGHWIVSHWTMSDDQLRRAPGAFDRSTPAGRRDYAMARCQALPWPDGPESSRLAVPRGPGPASGHAARCERAMGAGEGIAPARGDRLRDCGVPPTGRTCDRLPTGFVRHTLPVGMAISRGLIAAVMRLPRPRRGVSSVGRHPCPAAHRGHPPAPPATAPLDEERATPLAHPDDRNWLVFGDRCQMVRMRWALPSDSAMTPRNRRAQRRNRFVACPDEKRGATTTVVKLGQRTCRPGRLSEGVLSPHRRRADTSSSQVMR